MTGTAGRKCGMRWMIPLFLFVLAACGTRDAAPVAPALYPGETPEIRAKVNYWAEHHDIPRSLLHRVIQRESDYRANARNGPYYGLMQILPETARGIGFRGRDGDLLDPDTNLRWGGKYLRGAWLLAEGDEARAVQLYARGYYYEARDRCMLRATGLRATEVRSVCG